MTDFKTKYLALKRVYTKLKTGGSSITIPSSVTSIGNGEYMGRSSLTSITTVSYTHLTLPTKA